MKKISNKFHPGAQTISFFFGDLFFGIALKLEKVGSQKNFVRLSSPLYTFFLRDYNTEHIPCFCSKKLIIMQCYRYPQETKILRF